MSMPGLGDRSSSCTDPAGPALFLRIRVYPCSSVVEVRFLEQSLRLARHNQLLVGRNHEHLHLGTRAGDDGFGGSGRGILFLVEEDADLVEVGANRGAD